MQEQFNPGTTSGARSTGHDFNHAISPQIERQITELMAEALTVAAAEIGAPGLDEDQPLEDTDDDESKYPYMRVDTYLPFDPDTKLPLVPMDQASSDLQQIRKWWDEFPHAIARAGMLDIKPQGPIWARPDFDADAYFKKDGAEATPQPPPEPAPPAQPPPRIPFLTIDQLKAFKPPQMLIEGVLAEIGLSVMWGPPSSFKSFVALDLGLCVATNHPWHGRSVKSGLVIYIAAEGMIGITNRIIGWTCCYQELPPPNLLVVPCTVTLVKDVAELIAGISKLDQQPVLIIIDTLARTFGTGNENQQSDMNAYVNAADTLRSATKAHVMIIHHSGVHEANRERGSNVLRGAVDTVIAVKRNGDYVDLVNRAPMGKQKEAEEFATIKLEARKVYYTVDDVEYSTRALARREGLFGETDEDDDDQESQRLGKIEKAIGKALAGATEPLSWAMLQQRTKAEKGNLNRALRTLKAKELIIRNGDLYALTDRGRDEFA
jgi:hypothetical protein